MISDNLGQREPRRFPNETYSLSKLLASFLFVSFENVLFRAHRIDGLYVYITMLKHACIRAKNKGLRDFFFFFLHRPAVERY